MFDGNQKSNYMKHKLCRYKNNCKWYLDKENKQLTVIWLEGLSMIELNVLFSDLKTALNHNFFEYLSTNCQKNVYDFNSDNNGFLAMNDKYYSGTHDFWGSNEIVFAKLVNMANMTN